MGMPTIIKADPGWYAVYYDGENLHYHIVIAWEIRPDIRPIPITTDGTPSQWEGSWCLKTPDGKFDIEWQTEEDVKDYLERVFVARSERQKA